VLFGDLLISGMENSEKIVNVPGVGQATNVFPKNSGYTITKLTQKICVINERFAVSWAGSHIAARTVIGELEYLSKMPNFSSNTISTYFKNIDESIEKLGVSFIALYIEDSEESRVKAKILSHNVRHYPSTPLGSLFIEGTGLDDTIKLLREYGNAKSESDKHPSSEDMAISAVFYLGATLLNEDITSQKTLLQYYGGGYEAVLFNDGKLTKLNNTAFVYWQAQILADGSISISLPKKVFYHHYHNDILCIRYLLIEHGDSDEYVELKLKEHTLYMIPSIIKKAKKEDAQAVLLSEIVTDRVANYINVFDKDNKYLITLYYFEFLKNKNPGIRFDLNAVNNSLTMSIDKELLITIKDMIVKIDIENN